jgi:hypothetical protein
MDWREFRKGRSVWDGLYTLDQVIGLVYRGTGVHTLPSYLSQAPNSTMRISI